MGREEFDGVDLFGNPVPLRREGPGRPQHEWTPERSNKVNLLFATGHTPKDAASALGITMPTFRKHYFSELGPWRSARLKLKADMLQRLHDEGAKGNVGAIKELFKQMEKGAVTRLSDEIANRQLKAPAKGKKAQAAEAAETYRGKYAPPEEPSRIN